MARFTGKNSTLIDSIAEIGPTHTGCGADNLVIDDPMKPDDALFDVICNGVHAWFDGTAYISYGFHADHSRLLRARNSG